MKYAIVIPDGCADEPQEQLDGRTPLAAAQLPAMDRIAKLGLVGSANHVPHHLSPGSAVANMSLLGYDPNQHFTGRAPLEAAAQGIELGPNDWAVRCNLVTIEDQVMKDFTADHISSEEAVQLLAAAGEQLTDDRLEYIPGVSYRNLLIYRERQDVEEPSPPFSADTRSTPPHDLTDKMVVDDFPRGPGSDLLCQLMNSTVDCFANHPVNLARRESGQLPATNTWLWGLGRTPQLPEFAGLHGQQGAMITAVDLLRGLAALIGWERIEVEGATGYTDTDYAAKGRAAIDALQTHDVVCVHVEATDEASHEGDLEAKITALEAIDNLIVAPLHAALEDLEEYRILVTPDHPTPLRTRTHSHGAVPFALCGHQVTVDEATTYDELAAGQSDYQFPEGHELMSFFLTNELPSNTQRRTDQTEP